MYLYGTHPWPGQQAVCEVRTCVLADDPRDWACIVALTELRSAFINSLGHALVLSQALCDNQAHACTG